jgi:hypothetical protein
MNPEIYKIAAKACSDVYDQNTDIGTTEYSVSYDSDSNIQILAIAGTNEPEDMLININMFSRKGIKYGAYKAAWDIMSVFRWRGDCKRMVTGHSKAGPTAIAFKRLFGADYCVAFSPARSLRYWSKRKMENTTIFIDPDDIVPKLGFFSFGHPKCKTIKAKNDHIGISIDDHGMDHWINFTKRMK